jgi:cytochrome c oxidase subunit III
MAPPTPTPETKQVAAQQMLLWLYIGSMIMIFAGLTSAYLVSKGEGKWLQFELPRLLWVSTGVILLSSLTMMLAVRAAREARVERLQLWLGLTTLLGVGFLLAQVVAWQNLVLNNIYLVGNASGSFLYMLTGMHMVHLVAGLLALVVITVRAVRLQVGPDRIRGLEQVATFWHSLDFLWCFLFLFLLLNH